MSSSSRTFQPLQIFNRQKWDESGWIECLKREKPWKYSKLGDSYLPFLWRWLLLCFNKVCHFHSLFSVYVQGFTILPITFNFLGPAAVASFMCWSSAFPGNPILCSSARTSDEHPSSQDHWIRITNSLQISLFPPILQNMYIMGFNTIGSLQLSVQHPK